MFRVYKTLAPVALAAAITACGGSDQSKSSEPASPKAAPDAKKVDPASAGTISGKVVIEGTVPENPVIKMGSDPACGSAEMRGETYVVDNGGLKNVFVYIKDGLGNKYIFDTPTQAVTIDQKGCHYVPHVVGVRTTQPLEIVNSDATLHNVNAMAHVNQGFNLGQAIQGMKNSKVFTAPEVMVRIKCDVHNWMNAYVGVLSHPYFAVTASVTLGEKETRTIGFAFKATTP